MTLPERVLRLLATVDSDRARAIVKLVESSLGQSVHSDPVTTVKIAKGKSIILVHNNEPLKRLPWLRLIEMAPARFLISIRTGTSIETMELGIRDLLEELPKEKSMERNTLDALLRLIHQSRITDTAMKEEILFIVTDD